MLDHPKALKALSDFLHTLLTPYDLNLVLDDLAVRLCDILQIAGAGVSLAQEGRLKMATALPPAIMPIEATQEATQTGPCIAAFQARQTVAVNDLSEAEHREMWPKYCATAEEIGLQAAAGIPMQVSDKSFGAVSLYATEVKHWQEDELFLARTFADAATVYLMNSSSYDRERALNEQLQHALDSRVVIEQAKGILAEAHGTDVQTAFESIRTHSRNHNTRVREVAEAIVERGLRL